MNNKDEVLQFFSCVNRCIRPEYNTEIPKNVMSQGIFSAAAAAAYKADCKSLI